MFHYMRSQHLQMAIVTDEFGLGAEVATLKDLIEEIFGRITNKWVTEPLVVEIDDDMLQVNGLKLIDEVNQDLGLGLPEDYRYDTITWFVLYQLRLIPDEG